jgi:uncharacterized protein
MIDTKTAGRFSGYAAIFDVPDSGRDIIRAGAFSKSLHMRSRFDVPLLWQHDQCEPIGIIEQLREDDRGLHITAKLSLDSARGKDAYALMKDGAISGLSIGYRARDARPMPRSSLRELRSVDLIEISLVSLPMQPLARLTAVS